MKTHPVLSKRLLQILHSLSYPEYEQCVTDLLRHMGYIQAKTLGRRHYRGRNRAGGAEIAAYTTPVATKHLVLTRLNHFKMPRTVQKRYIVEFMGTVAISEARQGIFITTSRFAPPAVTAATQGSRIAPILLMDNSTLVTQMIRYGIGVYRAPGDGRYRLYPYYFKRLNRVIRSPLKSNRALV